MSIELALIPVAIAVASALSTKTTDYSTNSHQIQTQIRNKELLQKTLVQLGCQSIATSDEVSLSVDATQIIFTTDEEQGFTALFTGDISQSQAENFVNNLHEEYFRVVQEQVYLRLKQQAPNHGLFLESETVQEDQSVLLTFSIGKEGY
ncbi:hypothetical protein [Hazenella coriacea]|uniref:Uncharacterized protein n=1 Tax=Hazenella coriacea TaxID=1179467 RepID=A0A4R3LGH6_9BACL|nr:hypothetical protein [Hazenella coriacea]TCS96606.1 hypothetical protein EDD58_101242 [Hazenella coriacea]